MVFSPELTFENSGFGSNYFENLAQLEENCFWFRSRNRLIPWALHKYLPKPEYF